MIAALVYIVWIIGAIASFRLLLREIPMRTPQDFMAASVTAAAWPAVVALAVARFIEERS